MKSRRRCAASALGAVLASGCGAAADLTASTAGTPDRLSPAGACGPVEESVAAPPDHVEAGTDLEYDTAPPASGLHWPQWPVLDRPFYTAQDRPPVEQLVHSQEHGWTVVWYDETLVADREQLVSLRELATQLAASGPQKVVVVPWESADGPLDSGHLAMTHWGAEKAYRQFCDRVDTDTVLRFAQDHPYTDSHEPNGP